MLGSERLASVGTRTHHRAQQTPAGMENLRKTDFAGRSMEDPCQWRVSVKSRLKILRLPFHLLGRGI